MESNAIRRSIHLTQLIGMRKYGRFTDNIGKPEGNLA
jgi:hypothetical protein